VNSKFCTILASIVVLLPFALAAGTEAAARETDASAVSPDEAEIRTVRQRFNEAFRVKDLDTLDTFFAPEYHIVTGRSEQSHGGAGEKAWFRKKFTDDPSFYCERSADRVDVNSGWGIAQELGRWQCDYTAQAEGIHSSGVYAAKWQRSASGKWLLLTEVFTTLHCEGNDVGCLPPDPLE
jgi:ketosteroid isomerase-like protein